MVKKQIPTWGWVIIALLAIIIIAKVDVGSLLMSVGSNSFVIQPGEEIKTCPELCNMNGYPVGFDVNSKQECVDIGGKSYITQGYSIAVPVIKCCCSDVSVIEDDTPIDPELEGEREIPHLLEAG